MTPRIPRGWTRATERGEGVQLWHSNGGRYFPSDHVWSGMLISSPWTYITRTDHAVPADPNEALRLEDEAARLVGELPQIPVSERPDHAPDAQPMVPGMMRLTSGRLFPLGSFRVEPRATGESEVALLGSGGAASRSWIDDRTPAEFAAAYTAAWEYTERRRAEIAEEVRRAGGPPAPDLGEWPGTAEVPPDTSRDVEILTPHGDCRGFYGSTTGSWYVRAGDALSKVSASDVLRWRELPRAVVEDGRVTGVRRG